VSENFKHNAVILVGGALLVGVCLSFGLGVWTVLPALGVVSALRW
jgi:hypothetical protein